MTSSFILNIFPQGSLAGSVITPIWIGVCIVAWFNLRLGWVLSGLVVPGYLVPLLLIKPWAVCVILIEAVLTYLLVWFFSERLSKVFGFTNFFGRDRFFALLAVSVLVRLGVDTFLLPLLGEYLRTEWGILFDYRNDFHSFGLIITALIANQLWKPGLRTGMMNIVVTVGLTWLVVRFLLMEYTNFSVGNLAYMYENLAASMEAGPKAYIILLTTAYIASYYNLKYGWEYNGIVIPALLALVWYHPAKILVSVLETCIILVLAAAILRLPVFKKITMEGARKILLFFNICFVYKLLLGHLVVRYFPEQRVTDLYGFGYLLTTLMAIKMYDKGTFIRTTRVTLQVSFISLALASLIGFSMTLMPNFFVTLSAHNAPRIPSLSSSSLQRAKSITEVIRTDQISLYRNLHRAVSPLPAEMEQFSEALAALKTFRQTKEATALQQARQLLARLNYGLEQVGKQFLYLREQPPGRGWGIYALRLDPTKHLLIEVPAPLDEPGTAGAGAVLFEKFSASALAVAGTHKNAKNNDVLRSHQSMLHIFQKTFGKSALLQVRGAPQGQTQQTQETRLWVRSKLPDPLNLTTLRSLTGPFDLRWGTRTEGNLLREDTEARFTELVLSAGGKRALLAGSVFSGEGVISREGELALRGYLQEQLRKSKQESAAKKTKPSPGPLLEELLFFDREVLTPQVRLVRSWPENDGLAMHKDALDSIADAAAVLGYELVHYRHTISGQEYLLLAQATGQKERPLGSAGNTGSGGSVVFRLGQGSDYIIQVPRPLSELQTAEYGTALFDKLNASALLLGGIQAGINTAADPLRPENRRNLFNLISQVLLRENSDRHLLIIQCRAAGRKDLGTDALLSCKDGLRLNDRSSTLKNTLTEQLQEDGLSWRLLAGEPVETGYRAGGIPQSLYLRQTTNKDFCALWLSPKTRSQYRHQLENTVQAQQFIALGIKSVVGDLFSRLASFPPGKGLASDQLPGLQNDIRQYIEFQDIIALQRLVRQWPALHFSRFLERSSGEAFLFVSTATGTRPVLVANLFPRSLEQTSSLSEDELNRANIEQYLSSKAAWLLITSE
ncbi:hypothetical protein KKHLCK_06820 [Candidatus Electrothrix laxa]